MPEPDKTNRTVEEPYVAPQTEVSKQLAKIWSELLGVSQVGIHDNFFTLGGDSILTIQFISRANQQGIPLSVKHLFEYPTIAELVALIQSKNVMKTAVQPLQDLVTGTYTINTNTKLVF